jgi:uncharacterized protein
MTGKIDVHHHLVNEPGYLERLLDTMDAHGIERVALSGLGLHGPTTIGDLSPTNDDTWRAYERAPDRVIPMAVIRLGVSRVEEVAALLDRGFRGVKTTRPLRPYDDSEYDEIYALLEQRRVPILFHTGVVLHTTEDRTDDVSSNRMRPVHLDRIARTFPDLIAIMAHLGVPWHDEAAAMIRFHPNVYADLTGAPGGWADRKPVGFFRELLGWPDTAPKLVFGTDVHPSDYPWAMACQQRILDEIADAIGDPEAFWSATARTWWPTA